MSLIRPEEMVLEIDGAFGLDTAGVKTIYSETNPPNAFGGVP